MNGAQTLVGIGGLGLIAVNYWTGSQRAPVTSILSTQPSTQQLAQSHGALVEIGGEFLFVLVAVVLSGTSDGLGKALVAVIVALWVLWGINHYSKAPSSSATSLPANKSTGTVAGHK